MSATDTNSLKSIPNINLQQIYAEEEDDNVVYSIREELIQNVLALTDKVSQERRIVKLVTECACEALKKLVSLHFYYHAESLGPDDLAWAPDEPTAPSPPDTWATKNVPVLPIPEEVKTEELSIYTYTPVDLMSCKCDLGVKCLCCFDSEERIRDQIEILYSPETKRVPHSTTTSKMDLEDASYEGDGADLESEEPSLDKKLEKESVPCVLKEGFSKIGLATNTLKLPKIEVPLPAFKRSELNVLELPPIRVAATFQAVTREVPQQKKTKKKKNNKKEKKK